MPSLSVHIYSFVNFLQKMEGLSKRMSKIATLSKDLSSAFSKHRANVSQLSDANKKVKSLQFLLCLPQKLQVSYLEFSLNFLKPLNVYYSCIFFHFCLLDLGRTEELWGSSENLFKGTTISFTLQGFTFHFWYIRWNSYYNGKSWRSG